MGIQMTPAQLKAFIRLSETGTLSQVARELAISQSTLTRQVQTLERELDAPLLVRTPRGVQLSASGERFLPFARRALDELTAGKAALEVLGRDPRGAVSLGSVLTVEANALPGVIAKFRERFPDVLVQLTQMHTQLLVERVSSGQLDLAIATLPVKHLDLKVQRLWQEEFVLAVPSDHPIANRTEPVALREVAGEPFIVMPGSGVTRALEQACRHAGITPQVAVETDNSESMRRLVERGIGMAMIPAVMLNVSRAHAAVRLADPGLTRQVGLIHRGDAYLTAAAKALKRAILSELKH